MRRVQVVYLVRRFGVLLFVEVAFFATVIVVGGVFVSVNDVFVNMKAVTGIPSLFNYLYVAIRDTEVSLQVLAAAGCAYSLYIGFLAVREARRLHPPSFETLQVS